ncbi:hypothetical protein [Lacipirellula parvula]|uniref:Uncharacterized protein n=1 Tax=Lacipirellula parvula TaxID=2650471 RepID=A0A5K7X4B3_9BACT|nr:hypothetical protein [Lacipirellula parvula]BBO30667.1 hypothetical protein PLANPX_0279 [Lacipirellula parvula]
MRAFVVGLIACGLMVASAGVSRAIEVSSFEPLLRDGKWAEAEKQLAGAVAADAKDDNARFALGTVQALRAFEGLLQGLYRYGLDPEWTTNLPFVRLPIPPNPKPTPMTNADFRKLISDFSAGLAKAEKTLAPIKSADVKLPLAIGSYRIDFNGDGKADESESFWGIFAEVVGAPIAEEEAKGFVIAFDAGDVHWLRGYCHVLQAFCDFFLAHDSQKLHDYTAPFFFPTAKTSFPSLPRESESRGGFDFSEILDGVAFVHLIQLPVIEPERLKSSHAHLLEMIAQSRLMWTAILAETDDDREWIPNPTQQNAALPGVAVSPDMIHSWHIVLDECEAILEGKKLITFWRPANGRGVNLKQVFFKPQEFDLVLWVQGSAAIPYLEDGPITSAEMWSEVQQVFGGQLGLFAVWFN